MVARHRSTSSLNFSSVVVRPKVHMRSVSACCAADFVGNSESVPSLTLCWRRRKLEKNVMLGLTMLERTGVTAYRGERMQLPETTASESG
jgi:hypothetical protein